MIITFIGMSGSGKSHWSKKLVDIGYVHICADDIIEQKLGDELTQHGYKGINDVSKWMGQPYDSRFERNSKRYIDLEGESMQEILVDIATRLLSENVVIDTTGSVIYLSPEILRELVKRSAIVYFHTPESALPQMTKLYLEDPKPVIWGDIFNQNDDETNLQAIARCYPLLLLDRTEKYEKLAHVTLEYDELRSPKMTPQKIVAAAKGLSG